MYNNTAILVLRHVGSVRSSLRNQPSMLSGHAANIFSISLVLQPQESFYCHFFSIKATSVTRATHTVLMKLKPAHAIPHNIMQCTTPNITNQHHALHAIPSCIMQFHAIQFSTCHKWIDEDKTNVSSPASERPATLATVDPQRLEPLVKCLTSNPARHEATKLLVKTFT